MSDFFTVVVNGGKPSKITPDTSYANQEMTRQMMGSQKLVEEHKKDAYRGPVCPLCQMEVAPADDFIEEGTTPFERFVLMINSTAGKKVRKHKVCPL